MSDGLSHNADALKEVIEGCNDIRGDPAFLQKLSAATHAIR